MSVTVEMPPLTFFGSSYPALYCILKIHGDPAPSRLLDASMSLHYDYIDQNDVHHHIILRNHKIRAPKLEIAWNEGFPREVHLARNLDLLKPHHITVARKVSVR